MYVYSCVPKQNNLQLQVLVHVADAPAHGKCFHSEDVSDNRLEEDLKAFDPLMAKIKEQNIAYWFGYVQKTAQI